MNVIVKSIFVKLMKIKADKNKKNTQPENVFSTPCDPTGHLCQGVR